MRGNRNHNVMLGLVPSIEHTCPKRLHQSATRQAYSTTIAVLNVLPIASQLVIDVSSD